jgi:c-di-AMP phosphodiesterase-like protein
MGHRFGDLDSVGAACGMAGAVINLEKEAFIAVDRTKNLASNLIDKIDEETEGALFIDPSLAESMIAPNDLLIIVDTHNKDYVESHTLYERARSVVVIDHHRKTVNFIDNAVISYHEPYASSASEMVTELIQYFNYPVEEKIAGCFADALLSGIMLDTKNFVMRTGVRTFEAAAYLKKLGADTIAVKHLFSNSIDSYRRKTQIVASAKIHKNCAIASADFKSDDIRIVAPQAADELLGITDVDASFVIYRTNNTVNISARSLGALNVQVIMEQLGGGGHQTMAATQLENITIEEASKALIIAIDDCKNTDTDLN